ncbi:MAG TPA: hypothetical protein VE244_04950 [Nitrososphaeraceae archaeon]|jgi:hypothetical protein|nr:hypothetical protein [Nitrososphaeraceae archaeon]
MRTITEVQNEEDNIEELAGNDVHASYPLTDKAYYVEEIHYKLEDSICFNVAD